MITIMGATGNIGSKLSETLLKSGQRVRLIGRDAAKLAKAKTAGAEVAIGDVNDAAFLSKAFEGSSAVFALIPPDYAATSFVSHYNKVSEAIVTAIKASHVTHVVNLSSIGADLPEGTGPIKGLYKHEQRLNKLEGVNVVHLRPAYFMENLLMNIPFIQSKGIMGGAIKGDIKFAMIATQDIADVAAKKLIEKNFQNISVEFLLGHRDVTLNDAAAVVSEKLGRKIPYVTFDSPSTKGALVGLGLSEDVANLFVEMSEAFNSGLIKAPARTKQNTTATTLETFVGQVFPKI